MKRISTLVAVVAGLQLAGHAQQPAQQQPAPVFRSSTRLIVTTVSVKDKDGRPIEGLTAKDFVITEDAQPQDIAFVEYQRLATEAAPVLEADAPPAAPAQAAAPAAPAQPEVAAATQAT